jgi:hypothetical protein
MYNFQILFHRSAHQRTSYKKNFGDIYMLQRALENFQNQPPSYHVANILKFKFAPVFFLVNFLSSLKQELSGTMQRK